MEQGTPSKPEQGSSSQACPSHEGKLIDIGQAASLHPAVPRLLRHFGPLVEQALAIKELNLKYARAARNRAIGEDPYGSWLEELGVSVVTSPTDLSAVPSKGPLVVVANHPFGGLEALALARVLKSVRRDFKILANYILKRVPEISGDIIPVDVFEGPDSGKANIAGLKQSVRWLRGGGALIVFPAGEVSHLDLFRMRIEDRKWSLHVGSLLRMSKATVLPIYVRGRNSALFQAAGLLHPMLRTALLMREMNNKSGSTVRLTAGSPMPWQVLSRFDDDAELVEYLRMTVYFLRHREHADPPGLLSRLVSETANGMEPLEPSVPATLLSSEIETLPPGQRLVSAGDFDVWIARAHQIPNLLREIGRLRESTFRQVQEGTGRATDIDRFDDHYLHLFLWNASSREIAGAYRVGLVDEILETMGPSGLYTSTLFKFRPEFVDRMRNALEFGRSFIRSDYQRKHSCLSLIWRGIGEYVSRNPHYTAFFGPVSISRDYMAVSKDLMVHFLRNNRPFPDLERLVKARRPFKPGKGRIEPDKAHAGVLKDIDDVSLLVAEIERDKKGVPILLKHYMKLNARIISFNVDRDFSDVVDGLIHVNLFETDPKLMRRFMGRAGHESWSQHNGVLSDLDSRAENR